jgi:hypothetical protein
MAVTQWYVWYLIFYVVVHRVVFFSVGISVDTLRYSRLTLLLYPSLSCSWGLWDVRRLTGRHWIGGGGKGKTNYWDPKIIFCVICSFSKIGDDETKVSVVLRTSTYIDLLLVSLRLRQFETL